MTLTAKVRDSILIPAATHVDGTARVQTVTGCQNSELYQLLRSFELRAGCPSLLNTSFNVRGEPIVCSVRDALDCFLGTGLDALVVGNSLLRKSSLSEDQVAAGRRGKADRVAMHELEGSSRSWARRIKSCLHSVSFPLRWLVSHLFLTIMYLLLVTPIGLCRRCFKRPAFSKQAATYWQSRSTADDKTDYFKQY